MNNLSNYDVIPCLIRSFLFNSISTYQNHLNPKSENHFENSNLKWGTIRLKMNTKIFIIKGICNLEGFSRK